MSQAGRGTPLHYVFIVYLITVALVALPMLFAIDFKLPDLKLSQYRFGLDPKALFVFPALLPGFLGLVYHLVTVRQRRDQNRLAVKNYYDFRNKDGRARAHEKDVTLLDDATPGPVSANCASGLLTAVFVFVALMRAYGPDNLGVQGAFYAGVGAYISVLYYMVPRIYASALSSRFLMTSALRSASAVALGFVLGLIGDKTFLASNEQLSQFVIFLSGLFHNMAIDALRARARRVFGASEPEAAEIPIAVIEGVDDVAADLLHEYGVSSVQHLATAEPGDLCERTLLPLDRILDWIDQALLISYLKRNIAGARELGIRGAINLVLVYIDSLARKDGEAATLLKSLAEKTSLPPAAIAHIAKELRADYMVGLIYELRDAIKLPDTPQPESLTTMVAEEITNKWSFVVGEGEGQPVRLQIKPQP
jgi:hypothetical protein